MNDLGTVAFLGRREQDPIDVYSAYLWDPSGALRSLAVVGADAPGGAAIRQVFGARLYRRSSAALLSLGVQSGNDAFEGLYLFRDDKLTLLLKAGQEMPGGGKLGRIGQISALNDAGQAALLAQLDGGASAAYLLDAEGKLTLLVKSGDKTPFGEIVEVGDPYSRLGSGVGLNNRGQVALSVETGDGLETLVVLTPPTP
jgi:hypothetical protein